MKNKRNRVLPSLLLIAIVLAMCVPPMGAAANPAVSAEICVVYDNSGSTFRDETWCRYKYTLEVLASLIDYKNGGRMRIYPLNPVSIDGRASSASCEPIVIDSYNDIGKITNIYTVTPAGTPFEPVVEAYDYLVNHSSAEDKRLVILTDGLFDHHRPVREHLLEMVSGGEVKIHYLCSGNAENIIPDSEKGLFSHYLPGVVDARALLDILFDIYADIYNQSNFHIANSEAAQINITDGSRVVVYAAGSSSEGMDFTAANGVSLPALSDSGKHTYSEHSAEGFENAPVDRELVCFISVFEACPPGAYTLQCSGADYATVFLLESSGVMTPADESQDDTQDTLPPDRHLAVLVGLGGLVAAAVPVILLVLRKRAKKKYEIFISYRREGGDAFAGRLADRFRLLGYNTFFDMESMHAGGFNEQIFKAIDECQDVLLVLPPNALDRCTDKNDWLRIEIEYSLRKQKNIIPVMMRGFEFPETLPDEINDVRFREGVTESMEYFEAVVGKIEGYLDCRKRRR